MQSLISGAECSTTSNPLSQVLKHTEGDRSLQKDRVEGPSNLTLRRLPQTLVQPTNVADLAMARQFFDTKPVHNNVIVYNSPQMSSPQVMGNLHAFSGPRPPATGPAMLTPAINAPSPVSTNIFNWSEEFKQLPQPMFGSVQPRLDGTYQTPGYTSYDYNMMPLAGFQPSFRGPMSLNWDQPFSGLDIKGKGKAVDAGFEAAFARAAEAIPAEKSRIVEVNNETESLEAAFERTQLIEADGTQEEKLLSDFEKVWEKLRSSEIPPAAEDRAKWEAEFNQLMESERDDSLEGFESAWYGQNDEDYQLPEPIKYDNEGIPLLDPYKFELSNPYVAESGNHLARAKELMNENGSLTQIALLLEAAIQHGELGMGGYEAWLLLGETRSMDEREEAGMRALREGVRRAQEAGNNDAGMISLAISYTNESFDGASHTTLLRWLVAQYPDVVPDDLKGPLPGSSWASHDWVKDAFLTVARYQHGLGQMDPDVQIGLGVLLYTNTEFDKAKDCFESALTVRPKDYLLWNRLGSCLSNGSKPEEALGVYREALQLRPTYTRAIYNVGVACLNIGAHKEAAEHFLSALAMQESSGDKSEQLWHTLRKCFIAMERNDLAEVAKAGQSLDLFRKEGFEF